MDSMGGSLVAARGSARAHAVWALLLACSGCYAPIHSPGIPARRLPDDYRIPMRTGGPPLNYASLVSPPPTAYVLGPGDVLEVTVPDLIQQGRAEPMQAAVLETGDLHLPRVGAIRVAGLTIAVAQGQINAALANGVLVNPGATVTLVEKGTVNVLVLGAVRRPGVHALPRFENDVGHALGAAGGLADESGDAIEVHRRTGAAAIPWGAPVPSAAFGGPGPFMAQEPALPFPAGAAAKAAPSGVVQAGFQSPGGRPPASGVQTAQWLRPAHAPATPPSPMSASYRSIQASHSVAMPGPASVPAMVASGAPPAGIPTPSPQGGGPASFPDPIVRIPLHGADTWNWRPDEVILGPGDVVVVPPRNQEVFFVVGKLSEVNRTRFTVGDRDREIGNGFLLPPDREVDVVTAVAMAGYIDPIDSPTTVTLHRVEPDGAPLLVRVDLIRARSDPQENMLVRSGDIIYLNPDCWWYWRRLFDRVIDTVLGAAGGDWLGP